MKRARRSTAATVGMLGICSAVATVAHSAPPTAEEQYMLELTNRMRVNPQRELSFMTNINPGPVPAWGEPWSDDVDIAGALEFFDVDAAELVRQWDELVPAPALAWSDELNEAAQYHNSRMIFHQDQQHEFPFEPGLVERIEARGYDNWETLGENIYAYSENVEYGHAGFAIDWGPGFGGIQTPAGHRESIMNPDFREVGIGLTSYTPPVPPDPTVDYVGPLLITQDFGAEPGRVFVTGVLYNDSVKRDNFYSVGEGLGNVTVTAYLPGTNTVVATTTTPASGGYKLDLNPGLYDIAFSGNGGGRDIVYRNVLMGVENVKLDSLTSWIADGDGTWNNPANWFAGVPNGEGTVASLYDAATARRTISVVAPVTVGTINFENPAGYTVAGPGLISLSGRTDPRASINVIGPGSHEIGAGLLFATQSPTVAVDDGGVLTLAGPVDFNNKSVTRTGGGVLNINGPQVHRTDSLFQLNGGTTNINSDGGTNAVPGLFLTASNVGTVVNFGSTQHLRGLRVEGARASLAPGGNKVLFLKNPTATPVIVNAGTLDLNDNDMIVQSSAANRDAALANVVNLIRSARSGPTPWQGSGITSSAAAARPVTGLAAMLNPGLATFSGEVVDANAVLVKYTYNGDANFDGRINSDDYFRIDSGFLAQPVNPGYRDGDFNYDNRINSDDYFLIDSAFLGQGVPLDGAVLAAVAVPEPGVAMLSIGASLLMLRRRR